MIPSKLNWNAYGNWCEHRQLPKCEFCRSKDSFQLNICLYSFVWVRERFCFVFSFIRFKYAKWDQTKKKSGFGIFCCSLFFLSSRFLLCGIYLSLFDCVCVCVLLTFHSMLLNSPSMLHRLAQCERIQRVQHGFMNSYEFLYCWIRVLWSLG